LSAGLLVACDRQPPATPTPAATPLPPIERVATGGSIRASANIKPAQMAELGFPTVGRVREVAAAVSDEVEQGTPLIVLDRVAAEAAVEQAESALFQAQAALQDLVDGPRAEEISIAQAQLEAAQARLAQLAEESRPGDIAAAEAELRAAQSAYGRLFTGPDEEARITALAELANAKAARQQAQSAYNEVSWQSNVGMLPESRQLQEATNNLEAAQARYDALFADPDAAAIAAAQARIERAEAELERLRTPGSANQVAEAAAQVRSAQAALDLLTAGARDGAVAAAAVAVTEAEAGLKRAAATLEDHTLRAPFDGTITAIAVNPGEMVQVGQTALTLADLNHLQVETTDLSERDVARVEIGQAVEVFVEALNDTFPGRVLRISPQASVIGGDIVYSVIIDLEERPPELRWGMSADVEILDR
jgi:HlyD family secretion protein